MQGRKQRVERKRWWEKSTEESRDVTTWQRQKIREGSKKAGKKGEEKEPELFKAGKDDQVISSNLLDQKRK